VTPGRRRYTHTLPGERGAGAGSARPLRRRRRPRREAWSAVTCSLGRSRSPWTSSEGAQRRNPAELQTGWRGEVERANRSVAVVCAGCAARSTALRGTSSERRTGVQRRLPPGPSLELAAAGELFASTLHAPRHLGEPPTPRTRWHVLVNRRSRVIARVDREQLPCLGLIAGRP
jgi:hypothetical protein